MLTVTFSIFVGLTQKRPKIVWPERGNTSPIFLPIGTCWAPFGQGVHDGVHQAPVVQEGRLKGVGEAEGVFGTKFFARVTDEINGLKMKDKRSNNNN